MSVTRRFLLLLGVVLCCAAVAMAQNLCVQDEYQLVNKQKLNCTANDVRIAKVQNVRDPITGAAITTCQAGQTFNFLADFQIVTTSSQSRENIGLYIATTSQTQALTGACVDHIISPAHTCAANAALSCGSDNFHNTDPAPDNCGDGASSDFSATFGAGAQKVTLEIDNFLCQAPAGTNQVQLPNCTSWQIPGGTIQCVSTSPDTYPLNGPGATPTAIPGSPSKCNCGIIPLGVTVQNPSVTVTKNCTTNQGSGTLPTPTCNILPEGGTVTYTIDIINSSNFGSIVVDQICDNQYGTIFKAATFSGTACPAGTIGTKGSFVSTTCSALTVAQNDHQSCTFIATQVEDVTVTDTVTVQGHGSQSGTFGPSTSNAATVISHEAATTGTITKAFSANTAACVTARYNVTVTNTSLAGTDETLTIGSLADDSFGNITLWTGSSTANPKVLGTTCGQTTGQGTLAGTAGPGALPKTLAVGGGSYACQFDAQICGNLDGSGCFTHTNTASVVATDDETQNVTVSGGGPITVKECIVGSQP